MKPWRDLADLPMPARLARLPRDGRGYPIPVNVVNANGVLDFRATDPVKLERLIDRRCCALCGEPLGSRIVFVGGPRSIASRFFTDPPMHRDCATYALQVCPFLAAPSFSYRRAVPDGMSVNEDVSTTRPDVFGMGVCRSFAVGSLDGVHAVLRASEFEEVLWWRNGAPAADIPPTQAEAA